jgi:hypothetical protein
MKGTSRTLLNVGLLGIALMTASVSAQAQEPKYKVGDRVEFDVLQTGDPARAQWKKATIIRIDVVKLSSTLTQTNYVVQVDPLPGKLPQTYTVSQRLAEQGMTYSGDRSRSIGFIRLLGGGGAAPKIESDKLRVDANGTVLADRDVLDCEHIQQGRARNGQPPPTELAKKLIRCLFEKPSAARQDGATTVDITGFAPGPSHRWDPYNDIGSGATINTIVYTFRVKFNQKSFYHEHNEAHVGVERIFSCYVDEEVHGWYCGQYRSLKDGETKMIPVTRD